ncbi:MAG: hypothetical protein K2H09_06420 [Treponemataceae bacterium]|nr:hypothetical protein [Treponemataceae bacterium]
MKMGRTVAAALLLAALLAGCADGGNNGGTTGGNGSGIPSVPEVELPPSEGEDIFKGRTFSDGSDQYVFSDDGMAVVYNEGNAERQYRYSVNSSKGELYWKVEKIVMPGNAELLSAAECIAYYTDGGYLRAYEEYFKGSSNNEIGQDELDEALADVKKWLDEEVENGCPGTVHTFSAMKRFTYAADGFQLALKEQYEAGSAAFVQENPKNPAFGSMEVDFSVLYARMYMKDGNKEAGFREKPYSFSTEGKIIFVTDNDDSKKIFAAYTVRNPGNDAQLILSFEYEGGLVEEALDFSPDELHLTEVPAPRQQSAAAPAKRRPVLSS